MWLRAQEMYAERSSIFCERNQEGSARRTREKARKRTNHDVRTAGRGPVLEVQADEMPRQPTIVDLVNLVEDEVEQVESRDEGRGQVDVARDGPVEVVLAADGVGGGQDRGARIEGRDDAGFRDGDGLLFLCARAAMSSRTRARTKERTMTS